MTSEEAALDIIFIAPTLSQNNTAFAGHISATDKNKLIHIKQIADIWFPQVSI